MTEAKSMNLDERIEAAIAKIAPGWTDDDQYGRETWRRNARDWAELLFPELHATPPTHAIVPISPQNVKFTTLPGMPEGWILVVHPDIPPHVWNGKTMEPVELEPLEAAAKAAHLNRRDGAK